MSLALWRWKMPLGYWERERDVTPETAAQWLAVFRKDEPLVAFTVAAKRPRKPASWNRETGSWEP